MVDNLESDRESVDIMRDIARLSSTRGGRKYLVKMLTHAKKVFKDGMDQDGELEQIDEQEMRESADYFKDWSSSKTYFFDLTGFRDQNGISWEPVKVKSKEGKDVIDMVMSKFSKKLSQYEVSPDLIQDKIIEIPELDKAFKIGFTKKSEAHVQGFIKELEVDEKEKKNDEDGFLIRDDSKILVVNKKYKKMKKTEMYEKIKQRMQKHPELIEDIFFYSHMVLKPGGE